MVQSTLILMLPVALLIDAALLFTWLVMMYLDGYAVPKRVTIRGVLIATAIFLVHVVLFAAYFSQETGELPFDKIGESMLRGPD